MTARDHARRAAQRFGNEREIADPGPSLPDRLAAARERKGVDLIRAERDTKIRVRYLSALERGDYPDLPGAVYTKGFLRNYALYLGLDPEDVLRQWRRERGEQTAPEAVIVPPRPLEEPSRPLHFSPSIVVAAMLTVGVVLFFVYLGSQLLRYSKPPELTVTNPAAAVLTVDESATNIPRRHDEPGLDRDRHSRGSRGAQPRRPVGGEWSVQVDLRAARTGSRSRRATETGKEAETPREVVITVPFLAAQAPTLTISQPVEGTTYGNGAIAVEGTTTNAKSVSVTALFLGTAAGAPATAPPPKPAPSGAAPSGPAGPRYPDADGRRCRGRTFAFPPLDLQPDTGDHGPASSTDGKTASQTRTITVAYEGVNLVVNILAARPGSRSGSTASSWARRPARSTRPASH